MENPSMQKILKPRHEGETIKIAETVLRRKHHDTQGMARNARKRAEKRKRESIKSKRNMGILTPEKLIKNKRLQIVDSKRLHRLKSIKDSSHVKCSNQFPVFFVVRNARQPVSRSSFEILKKLGITKKYTATFLPNNADMIRLLRSIKIFVFYGFLNLDVMVNLFFKKLKFTVPHDHPSTNETELNSNKETVVVCDNATVEDHLGHLDILCVEDVLHEVKNCGSRFSEIQKILSPFQLGDIHKAEGIDANILVSGFHGIHINEIVAKLL